MCSDARLVARRRINVAIIHHQVSINAPVAKVYQAISRAHGIGTWWDKQTPTQTDRGLVLEHNPGSGARRSKIEGSPTDPKQAR